MEGKGTVPAGLLERIRLGRYPNALILSGGGRAALGDWLTMAYLCAGEAPPCGHCPHCRKAQLGIHPDAVRVGAAEETLKVDALRAMRRDVYIRPNEAARKVYRIAADGMNLAGQNVLLKLLEEGPAYAAFFLESKSPEALLGTVRSRCETAFAPEEVQGQTQDGQCLAFAALLEAEAPGLSRMEFLVALEKQSREGIRALLDGTRDLLLPKAVGNPRLLPTLSALGEVRAACETNISPGHLAGLLMAKLL